MGFSKVIIFSAFLVLWGMLGFVEPAAAQSLNDFSFFHLTFQTNIDLLRDINPLDNVLPAGLNYKPTTAVLLCDIRQYMCGTVGLVLIATTVFTTGVLILAQKITWPTAVLSVVLISMFVYASELADLVLRTGVFGFIYDEISDFSCKCF